jgi:hypothetical protein
MGRKVKMTEPTIICPNCKTEIKLTESLAAPLVESIRQEYEKRLTQKDADYAKRERSLREKEEALVNATETFDDQVAERLKLERSKIAAEEAKKAKLEASTDLEQKAKEITDLQDVLKKRDEKLAEAQKAQSELLRKQRELDDARRELELTVEKRVQDGLEVTREQALKEAEARLETRVKEKEQAITAMQKQIEEFKRKDADIAKREESLLGKEDELAKARESIGDQVAERLKLERGKIADEEARKAKLAAATDIEQKAREINDLQDILQQREEKLAEAQKAQAELLRKQRELDDAKRELELTVEKRVQEGLDTTREQARKEAEEQMKLKVMEKEHTITSMQKQIEELKRRADQGSQQLQGEVQELELEALLAAKFPRDTIEPVPKGEHGGDVLQRVNGPIGQLCGTILWEAKRTKNWSDGWLVKLREDQRAAKAEIAVLVSQALPKGVESFELIDGVWVTHPRAALPVAVTLRHTLLEVSLARQSSEGQQTKMEMVYQYLTGPRFRQRVQAIVEAFSSMQEDLDKEKRAITKQWAKREEQIERVMGATVGMYGDLQGIAGRSLQEIDGLELQALEAGTNT